MIRIRGLSLTRAQSRLLVDADAVIHEGERVALIGANGSGKSTLLAALRGEVIPEAGTIEIPALRIHSLEQAMPVGSLALWRYVALGHPELIDLEQRLAAIQQQPDCPATSDPALDIASLYERWQEIDGDRTHARICELLSGLGFETSQFEMPVDALSGGWRMRLNLARAMFVPSDLLLLDEPTNHLDLDAILWLERWLCRYPGRVIVVSHDRDFLDRVAHTTLSIEQRQLFRYRGGYSAAELARAERTRLNQRIADEQARKVAELSRFIDRFRAQATKARQVQSRIKAMQRMTQIAVQRGPAIYDFELAPAEAAPDPLILVDQVDAGYEHSRILSKVSLQIRKGARLGVLGRNGAGKSTLIRTLTGQLPTLAGELFRAGSLAMGYFAQTSLEALARDDTPLVLIRREWPLLSETELRARLGRFGFGADDVLRPVGTLSGGEKARLVLGLIVLKKPHLLILDEPTNHLDGDTRDALGQALVDFDGGLVLVSHDRYLLRATVDQFLLVHDGKVEAFDGDLDDYAQWLGSRNSRFSSDGPDGQASHSRQKSTGAGSRRDDRRERAQTRQRETELLGPIDRELASIEQRLAEATRELSVLDAELANPQIYEIVHKARMLQLKMRHGELMVRRDQHEARWLELQEQRELLLQNLRTETSVATRN